MMNSISDRCLSMGARSSCRIFETFSCALQLIICNKFHTQGMSHMIDDFFSSLENKVPRVVFKICHSL